MEPLITAAVTAIATKLAGNAVAKITDELPKRIRKEIGADPTALEKCFAAGFQAALNEMRPPDRERLTRYEGVLSHWLELPEVAEELAKLVDVGAVIDDPTRAIDLPKLNALFKQAYPVDENPDAYTGLNFPATLRAFVRAYTATAEKQADKFPWLQFKLLKEMTERFDVRPSRNTLREMYLDWLAQDCDLLPLSIDPKAVTPDPSSKVTLREVYVPLDVAPLSTAEKGRMEKLIPRLRGDKPAITAEQLDAETREERISALRALAETRQAVLLGDPGSGKTTLINYLALCLAMNELDADHEWLTHLVDWTPGALLPVRVVLRHFANDAIPSNAQHGDAGMLRQYIQNETERHNYPGFFPDLYAELLDKGGLILLDGLDEVPDADGRRARVCEAIIDFARTAKRCRFIVTCRTYAYPRSPLEGFDVFPITRFSAEQIALFIDHWYDAVAPKELWTPDQTRAQADYLKAALDPQRKPALADLATRPLLLTLMAMLSTSAQGKLPEDRAELYEQCVELLIENWQRRKLVRDETGKTRVEGGLLEEIGIDKAGLRRALHRLAFDAHARQGASPTRNARTADIQMADLEAVLKPAVGGEEKFQTALKYIHDRAGLIYWRDPTYTFPHRSFQEYLAACHLGNLGDYIGETSRLVHADAEWWREVYLLQVGKQRANLGTAIALVNCLCFEDCDKMAQPQTIDWQSAILAGQALDELHLPEQIEEKRKQNEQVQLFETPLNRVRCWLETLLFKTPYLTPRERADAGLALGALGDSRNFYELCRIPAGEFTMGDKRSPQDESKKEHPVLVPEFWIAKYLTTCAQYQKFIDAGGYQKTEYWKTKAAKQWLKESTKQPRYWDDPRWNRPNLPVVGVTWFEASAFCEWMNEAFSILDLRFSIDDQVNRDLKSAIANRKLKIRLATEAEWEKTATWDFNRKRKLVYPWSDEFDPTKANTREGENPVNSTSSVGIYPNGASPCGALDMAGNVWEWCSTLYQEYPYRLDAKHESPEAQGNRVLRGGSWYSDVDYARGAVRSRGDPDLWNYN
ncbi:MAG: SUMF1/EgtB/PvdO family nonheme iron enzyme, partial [Chloroflexota bacterium]|nr:SUMF1/EgtB/PvdO family nonheme iron enzyme [Chloroflexota bacterium]